MANKVPITVAHGDGIGPEIMRATLMILEEAGAQLDIEPIEIGACVYERGFSSGIEPSSWDSLRRTKVFLKAPITTPQGGGFKSLNVTIRKSLGLFANVRPCVAYHPFVKTAHPGMDVVIVRENEEDLYAGIEHRQTDEVSQCLKFTSRLGSQRIIRYAFEYARAHGRSKVTCFSKDNIMKLTDGLFHRIFEEIAVEYPDLEHEHLIVDIGAARLADTPERFDVLVMQNLYGDILSDVAAQITGSVGLAGSANIGEQVAMFEAIHGSAPDIAGKGIANPSGILLGAAMMLDHIGQADIAERVHNAWLCTIEDGVHTGDIFKDGLSRERVGTEAFGKAVIARLGRTPRKFNPARYVTGAGRVRIEPIAPAIPAHKETVGVDVFFHDRPHSFDELASRLQKLDGDDLVLQIITSPGVKVWPDGFPETLCTDHWRARFMREDGKGISHMHIVALLSRAAEAGLDFVKIENLCTFDGQPGFSKGQGE